MVCCACVLPDNYPGISFDSDGICNFCRSHDEASYLGAAALEKALHEAANGERPRCIVPVSGGKDSTYVLYYLTKVLGLETIAVNYDAGFTHPEASANLQRVAKRLGVELVTVRSHRQKRLLVGNLRAYLEQPAPAMVPLMCTGCRVGIVGGACKVARERKINTIVMGFSHIEEAPFKANALAGDGGSVLRGLAQNLLQNPRYLAFGGPFTQAADYLHSYARVRAWGRALRLLHPGIRMISFFDYIEYHPERIQREVSSEVGWSCPDPENSWRFDCTIKLLLNYLYDVSWGFTADHDYLSARIREGYITRAQALSALGRQDASAGSAFELLSSMLAEVGAADLIPRLQAMQRTEELTA
jgi:hypothetical protein